MVLGPEALGGAVGYRVGKAFLSTAKSWCFLEQTPSTVGRLLCWGGIWLHLTRPSQLREAPSRSAVALGGSGHLAASIWHSPQILLYPSDSSGLGFPGGGGRASSPGLPQMAVINGPVRALGYDSGDKGLAGHERRAFGPVPCVCTHVLTLRGRGLPGERRGLLSLDPTERSVGPDGHCAGTHSTSRAIPGPHAIYQDSSFPAVAPSVCTGGRAPSGCMETRE